MSHVPPDSEELSNPSSGHTSHGVKSWSYQYSSTVGILLHKTRIIFSQHLHNKFQKGQTQNGSTTRVMVLKSPVIVGFTLDLQSESCISKWVMR